MSDQGATAQAKDKAQELAGQAQEQAQQAAGQARDQLRTQIDQRSSQAGERVSSQAGDLRSVGEQLRQQGKEQPAKLADQAADRLERAGGWLTESDADRILGDVEDFARKNPWAVMAGGLALGFAASRMLKASSTQRYESHPSRRPQIPAATGAEEERFTRQGVGVGTAAGTGMAPPNPAPPPTAHPPTGTSGVA